MTKYFEYTFNWKKKPLICKYYITGNALHAPLSTEGNIGR